MFNKLALGHIWLCAPGFERFLHGKICVILRCEHLDVQLFPRKLHAKFYTWEKSSTFKDKYAVNTVNFKGNLLNKYDFFKALDNP